MAVLPGVGTIVEVSSSLPAAETETGYEALSDFVEVGEISSLPEHGPASNLVTFVDLKTGAERKTFGSTNYGSMTIPVGYDPDDAGQAILRTANENRTAISVKVTYSDGEIAYYPAIVLSFTRQAVSDQVLGGNIQLEFSGRPVTIAPE